MKFSRIITDTAVAAEEFLKLFSAFSLSVMRDGVSFTVPGKNTNVTNPLE